MEIVTRYYFAIIIFVMVIFAVASSFSRFLVTYDYLISYEGTCDPNEASCFVYCENETCDDPLYYTIIERMAYTLVDLCGENSILDCSAADMCYSDEEYCVIYHCDTETDEGCSLDTELNST